MSSVYNKQYYENYDVGVDKVDYNTSVYTKDFLTGIAKKIVDDLHPQTVLDAGCAMGHLVAALRDLGVEAYGIDISEYAVSNAREDIREFCFQGSLSDSLPEGMPVKYDLVVTVEVLEHLYAEDGVKAIEQLCKLTDTVIFCSTPDDFSDPSHLNVQQREYWATIFARQGFFDDLSYRPTYLTPYAVCYRKQGDTIRQIQDYERTIRQMEAMWNQEKEKLKREQCQLAQEAKEANEKYSEEVRLRKQQKELAEEMQRRFEAEIYQNEEKNKELSEENKKEKEKYAALKKSEQELKKQTNVLSEQRNAALAKQNEVTALYMEVLNSTAWKCTKPMRAAGMFARRFLRRVPGVRLAYKGIKSLLNEGPRKAIDRVKAYLKRRKPVEMPVLTAEEAAKQRATKFSKEIKFSILVPLYNTPEKFLREMIQSVQDQTYINWELCLADGSDAEHSDVQKICEEYIQKDERIKYQKLEKNMGISGNTNACIDMAQGDYIALFDHDDLLHPAALYENMKVICEKDADFIYTDENTFHDTPADAFCPHFKPDYAPDTLRANNYICHFSVFKKSLLEKTGGFRPECDGSQDFDMVLRLTEQAKTIVHIPKILYFWRAHKGSVAESVGAKPYVIEAAHKAVSDHLKRVGLEGEVLDSAVPSMYRLKYKIHGNPLISILIPNKDHIEDLERCLMSIAAKTTYDNYEIIIIENNSTEEETFQYYKKLEGDPKVKIVYWDGKFNYSAINNFGFTYARGEHILLLNNDVEVIAPDWLQEMLMYSQRSDVGAVGVKLYYPDHTIQHAGIGIGLLTLAGHYHRHFDGNHPGYMGRLVYAQNVSAVTAACMMLPRHVFEEVKGLDETFEVAFNDVDLCMRVRKAGYLIVFTPFAELYHYESKSRGLEDTPEKRERFVGEVTRFQTRWAKELQEGDPYYNPNFSLNKEDFSVR